MGFFSDFFSTPEVHTDGSTTDRLDSGSVTRGPDGDIRESTMRETMLTGDTAAVTRNGNGEVINAQWVKK
jgi:hypothetical protein